MPTGVRRTVIAIVAVVIVVIGIIGYAITGFAYASSRVGGANRSLNTVVSHQNSLNSTFKDSDAKFSALNTANPDLKQTKILYDQFIASARSAGTTVDQDDASLVSARASLNGQQWLTALSKGALDKEAQRIDHARKGLATARTITADYVQVGQFFQSSVDVEIDLDMLGTQFANADLAGAKSTLATMKTHVDKSLQLSSAPGLPTDLHDLMVDFQALVADFGKLLDAAAAGDINATTSSELVVEKDANKISGYNLDKIQTAINGYFQPMIDAYNSELTKATA